MVMVKRERCNVHFWAALLLPTPEPRKQGKCISKNYGNRYKNVFKYLSYILCTDDLTMWLKTYPSRVAIYAVKA
jgi:hypothetical protein